MSRPRHLKPKKIQSPQFPIKFFACPNPDCACFNVFGGDNLSVAEHMGKNKAIRRLYCNVCQSRFSERKSSLMEYGKLPLPAVVRIVKCLSHGCSVEATADICDVDARTVQRIVDRGGQRSENFHRLQLDKLDNPLDVVQMDELHGRAADTDSEKKGPTRPTTLGRSVVQWAVHGVTRLWRSRAVL